MTANSNTSKFLDRIRKAYDLTVEQYNKGIDPLAAIPEEFKHSPEFQAFVEQSCNSAVSDIEEYLDPKAGMRFLDAGCCANLANYRLDEWSSTYYGVDISPALIEAMKGFVAREHISIGGLWTADLSKLPFQNDFFDIAAVIGVFEYCALDYIESSLHELNRVLKAQGKSVLDIPNQDHPDFPVMAKLEEYLGRPNIAHSRAAFEDILRPLFSIERCDDSRVMLKYFVTTTK